MNNMNTTIVLDFLRNIAANNDRTWFQNHRDEYLEAKNEFENFVEKAIRRIARFDDSIAHITVKDTVYRFYRDTRFSPDKAPYKRHLGAYIAAHGKKAFHGGYYIHMEPGNCMLACGCYYLPTNILTACRNEIMANTEEWLKCVENKKFESTFRKGEGSGFGLEKLKTCPAGFPRDFEYLDYLRMKDYCCWRNIDDHFLGNEDALDKMAEIFMTAKPMLDFVNAVIDDYE